MENSTFKCIKCESLIVGINMEGLRCKKCNGAIVPLKLEKKLSEGIKSQSINISVSVDTTDIDRALDKAKDLEEVLNKISKVSESLAESNKLIDTIKRMSWIDRERLYEELKKVINIMNY